MAVGSKGQLISTPMRRASAVRAAAAGGGWPWRRGRHSRRPLRSVPRIGRSPADAMQRTVTPRSSLATPPGAGQASLHTPASQAAQTPGADEHEPAEERHRRKAEAWKVQLPAELGSLKAAPPALPWRLQYRRGDPVLPDRRAVDSTLPPAAAANRRPSTSPAPVHLPPQAKAHKLGDIIVKQEAQNKELQRQLGVLQVAQEAALAAALGDDAPLSADDVAAMRQQLALAQSQLQQQVEELAAARAEHETRKEMLREAAGACAGEGGRQRGLQAAGHPPRPLPL